MFEVPRNIFLNLAKIALGAMLPVAGIAPIAGCPGHWSAAAPFLIAGALIIAANARVLRDCPPLLRATSDGVWLGGGSIIPWREVSTISYPRVARDGQGSAFRTSELRIAFHRRRALLAAPWPSWPTALLLGRVAISLETIEGRTGTVVARLEAMRLRACRGDGGAIGPIRKPPRARVVRR